MEPNRTDLRVISERLDMLLRELDADADPRVGARLHEVVELLMALHAAGLERMLELAADGGLGSPALRDRLADDPVLLPLLLIHDMHPHDVQVRLSRALDRLRPVVAARGCRASLASIDGSVARVRLDGGARLADGEGLRSTIASALLEIAPELTDVAFENAEPVVPTPPAPLIQIARGSSTVRPDVGTGTRE